MTHKIHRQVDSILNELTRLKTEQAMSFDQLQKTFERVKATYAPELEHLAEKITLREKELLKFQKKHRNALFQSDNDRLDLPHGALLYAIEKPVKRVKGMLATLKKLGLDEAIKTNPAVNWDEIEKWDDDRLKEVGTERIKKERFEYELSGALKNRVQ